MQRINSGDSLNMSLRSFMTSFHEKTARSRTAEQFQDGGGGADIEYHQNSSAFKYIPFGQWRSQARIFGRRNRVAPERAQEVKQGVASEGKLQNGDGPRRRGYRPPIRRC